ncbi:hypothetical protein NC653_018585 [Populus alba x Populus x berolinensis]|nr:hypothetical protein NC653_018585 [Populus alba x Populus x berolinensis]
MQEVELLSKARHEMCTNAGSKRRAIPLIKHLASDRSHLQTKMLVKIQEDGGDTQDLGSDIAADLQRAKGILSSGGIQEEKKTWQEKSPWSLAARNVRRHMEEKVHSYNIENEKETKQSDKRWSPQIWVCHAQALLMQASLYPATIFCISA